MKYSIEITNLTKEYKLYKNDKDRFKDLIFGKRYTPYNALKDININLPQGEVIGILGKNGSGKSTLLKMITGVVFPTSGSLKVNGTVSALLTAGFDGELTGRENIYLKGYGLGLEKKYIESKIQEIIDFAEIGEYIDQPVRMYSSGMKSRLGFAISVNINPDILVVDEVLAVGDEIFRKKCINKMDEIKREGKTILFVSHSISQVKSFCTKAMWLHKGEMLFYGDIEKVSRLYEQYLKGTSVNKILEDPKKYDTMIEIKQSLTNISIDDTVSRLSGYLLININEEIEITYLELFNNQRSIKIMPTSQIKTNKKITYDIDLKNSDIPKGEYKVKIHAKIGGKNYNREIWCANKFSQYIDSVNNIELNINKNRLNIKKI